MIPVPILLATPWNAVATIFDSKMMICNIQKWINNINKTEKKSNILRYLDVLADDAFVVVVDAVAAWAHSHGVAFADAVGVPLDHIVDGAFVPFVDVNACLCINKNDICRCQNNKLNLKN